MWGELEAEHGVDGKVRRGMGALSSGTSQRGSQPLDCDSQDRH